MVKFNRILCPTDFSEASLLALPYAVQLAQWSAAHIFLVHALPTFIPTYALEAKILEFPSSLRIDAEQRMNALVNEHIPPGIEATKLLLDGHPAESILRAVQDYKIDLIIITTPRHSAGHHLIFPSVTEKILHMAPVPVLTINRKE